MTQEFRTFTQRLTDEPNKTKRIFKVQAKTIVDRFGNDVVDSKGNKVWFPLTFDPDAAIAFGKSLASQPTVTAAQAFRRNVMQGGRQARCRYGRLRPGASGMVRAAAG